MPCPRGLARCRKVCAPKAGLGRQHPRAEWGLRHTCQSQIYNLSGDGRAWSSDGGLAEPQGPNPISAKVQGHRNLNVPSHCTSLGPAVPPPSCEGAQDSTAAFFWRLSPEEQTPASLPDPAHSSHPVAGDSIPIEKVTGIPAWRYAGEADQADKTVLPGGVTWTGEIISIVYRILPKWCSILCGWATYYSVHHIVISVRCKNSGISLSTQMILSNL